MKIVIDKLKARREQLIQGRDQRNTAVERGREELKMAYAARENSEDEIRELDEAIAKLEA